MSLRFTILGCGSSGGVPRIGGNWGTCDPDNPRNRRRRCSMLVQRASGEGTTNVLIDTSPDLRAQLLDTGISWVDGVIFTHEHADHIHGIDDLRVIALNGQRRVQTWADHRTTTRLMAGFNYCFERAPGSDYPAICEHHDLAPHKPVTVTGPGGDVTALPFEQVHGNIRSLGFRIGNLAYSSDINDVPEESIEALSGLDVWIVDALRYTYHPSHFALEDTLRWIEQLKPRRAILTNMHIDLDYDTLKSSLPDHVEPAYDNMVIESVD